MGSNEGYFVWDGFTQNYPQYHGTSPTLLRFDKQTGVTVGMDYIIGPVGANNYMTAVATDNDGNYITGGSFNGIFGDATQSMGTLSSVGESDFFVAKLSASVCGVPVVNTDSFLMQNIKLYPNPTADIINIETDEALFSYEVYDLLGKQLIKAKISGNKTIINL